MPWTKVAIDSESGPSDAAVYGRGERVLTYGEAIREALAQALERDKRVFVMGEGVDDPAGIFGSTLGLHKDFPGRVFDVPIAENALTGFAVGAALAGSRPVLVHMRMDFLPLSLDQLFNHAAKICYMSGGKSGVPMVVRSVIGRGWGSAAQHSQALHALFLHVPGLKVVMPSSAYEVKGLLLASIAGEDPVIFIEHRWLYDKKGFVPEEPYLIPLEKGVVRRSGKDVTIVAFSVMVEEALKAAEQLKRDGIDAEVVDPRVLNPLDEDLIVESVRKTGHLVFADAAWQSGGAAQIFAGRLLNRLRPLLRADVKIVAWEDVPTPASPVLEAAFYKDAPAIVRAAREVL